MKAIERKKNELTKFCREHLMCESCTLEQQRCGKGVSFDDGMSDSEIEECYAIAFPEKSKKRIVILSDGSKVMAREYDGSKIVREGSAKCSPDDEFDFHKGAEIAFKRLMEMSESGKPRFKAGMLVKVIKNGEPPLEIHHNFDIGLVVKVIRYEGNRIVCVGFTSRYENPLEQILNADQVEPFVK